MTDIPCGCIVIHNHTCPWSIPHGLFAIPMSIKNPVHEFKKCSTLDIELRRTARILFVQHGFSYKNIAYALKAWHGLSGNQESIARQVSKWANDDGWEEEKRQYFKEKTAINDRLGEAVHRQYRLMEAAQNSLINKINEGGLLPEGEDIDKRLKVLNTGLNSLLRQLERKAIRDDRDMIITGDEEVLVLMGALKRVFGPELQKKMPDIKKAYLAIADEVGLKTKGFGITDGRK